MSGPIAVSKQVIDSSQQVEDLQIGEGSSEAMDEASSSTIIQIGDDSSQHDEDATPPPTAIQKRDRSSPHANNSTPPKTDVHEELQRVVVMLEDSSNSWNKKRSLMRETKDGMCPVHLAAMKGDLDIIKEFMQLIPNCVEIRSNDGKTALHFAVENDQLEAVKMLLSNKEATYVGKMVSQDSDKDGNTALHLAAIHGADTQIVRELLKEPGVWVNAVNKKGLTALDIGAHHSAVLSREDDRRTKCAEIKTILEAVGGCGRYSRQSEGNESKIVDVDTVVASLIATITFAAIFQIPGGIEDDPKLQLYGGARKLSDPAFLWFSMYNTVALFTSLTVVMMWLLRERLPREFAYTNRSKVAGLSAICLGISIICTGLAFLCAYILIVTPITPVTHTATPVTHAPTPATHTPTHTVATYTELFWTVTPATHAPTHSVATYTKYTELFWTVIVVACLAPLIAWTTFLVMLVYKCYNFIFTRRPDPTPDPTFFAKSVLCTWFVIGVLIAHTVFGAVRFFNLYKRNCRWDSDRTYSLWGCEVVNSVLV